MPRILSAVFGLLRAYKEERWALMNGEENGRIFLRLLIANAPVCRLNPGGNYLYHMLSTSGNTTFYPQLTAVLSITLTLNTDCITERHQPNDVHNRKGLCSL
jgi:hypothetical protein